MKKIVPRKILQIRTFYLPCNGLPSSLNARSVQFATKRFSSTQSKQGIHGITVGGGKS